MECGCPKNRKTVPSGTIVSAFSLSSKPKSAKPRVTIDRIYSYSEIRICSVFLDLRLYASLNHISGCFPVEVIFWVVLPPLVGCQYGSDNPTVLLDLGTYGHL